MHVWKWPSIGMSLATFALVACASPQNFVLATDGGTTEPVQVDGGQKPHDSFEAPPGKLAIRVNKARRGKYNNEPTALELSITLANGAGSAPVPLNPVLFTVKTRGGLLFHGEPISGKSWVMEESCNVNSDLSANSSHACGIAFSLEGSAEPIEVTYSTPGTLTGTLDQRTATQTFTVEPCHTCGSACTYLDVDSANCGTCGTDISSRSDLVCKSGHAVCKDAKLTPCSQEDIGLHCVDLTSDYSHCGACGEHVEIGQECKNGKGVCPTGFTSCNGRCVNLKNDRDNCGTCGASVGLNQECNNGVLVCTVGTMCGSACVFLKSDPNNCGACGVRAPIDGACTDGVPGCANSTLCGNTCRNLQTDRFNCGACGRECSPGGFFLGLCGAGICQ